MNKNRLCVIYNFAQRYRKGIFKALDDEYECDWYFGNNRTNIKGLDLTVLKRTHELKNVFMGNTPVYFQRGVLSLARRYNEFLVLGELYCVSTWLLAAYVKLFTRKRIYYWSHGWYGRETTVKKVLKKIFFRLADGVFLYGNYAKELMVSGGFDARRLWVVHNSLDYDSQLKLREQCKKTDIFSAHFGNNFRCLLFIGRLTVSKRLDLLLQVISRLKDKGFDFNLVLIGDGEDSNRLHDLAAELGLMESVWVYGACYDEWINAELIYNADLCVSPGNVGLTAVHSMAFGTPVVTHNKFPYQGPEFEAIVEGRTGSFFEKDSADSLMQCIENWFGRHDYDREMIRQSCFDEIDSAWNPQFQMNVFKPILGKKKE